MRKIMTTIAAVAVLLPLSAQARLFHKDKDLRAAAAEQKAPSRVWTPGTEVRDWRGHQLVVLPRWQSEQAALGREDTSGHIP